MNTAGRKNKGRLGQQEVKKIFLLHAAGLLTSDDILSRSMGSLGSDLIFSKAGLDFFPFDVEVKRKKKIAMCKWLEQSQKRNTKDLISIVVYREDYQKNWNVTLSLEEFLNIWKRAKI